MATATIYPSSDGGVRYYDGTGTWSSIRGQSTGTDAYNSNDPQSFVYSDSTLPLIIRGFAMWDLATIPSGSTVTGVTLALYGTAVSGSGSVCLVSSTQASSTLATADYSRAGSTEYASRIALSSWSTSGYNTFTLDATGIAAVQAAIGGTFKTAFRHSSDLDNSSPGGSAYAQASMSEHTGTSQDPVLTVTYTPPATPTASDSWAWSDTARPVPPARRAVGSRVIIFESNGSAATFGSHYMTCVVARMSDGRLLAVARKSSGHAASDGILVGKISSNDGNTWGSEFTVHSGSYSYGNPKLRTLASGRVALVYMQNNAGSLSAWFKYSDDYGSTWSTPVQVSSGFTAGYEVPDDILELDNGDLLCAMYGRVVPAEWTIKVVKSTDDGATWSALSSIGSIGGYNTVESQMELLPSGDIYMTLHREDASGGVGSTFYRTLSTDDGASWATPTQVRTDTFNRQGLTVMDDGRVIISFVDFSELALYYYESWDGKIIGSEVLVKASPAGDSTLISPIWCMATALGGTGVSQNVGISYDVESGLQTLASVYWQQFTGTDGTVSRPAVDSWAWSDSATQTHSLNKTTSDAWAWSDTAAGIAYPLIGTYERTTSDAWAWGDTAGGSYGASNALTTSDSWAWSDVTHPELRGGSRTTSDFWAWVDSTGLNPGPAFYFWHNRRNDKHMAKTYKIVKESGARTTAYTSETFEAEDEAGVLVTLNVTAASGTGGLTVRINGIDLASAGTFTLNSAPTAVTSTGTYTYAIYPFGAVGNATQSTSGYLPRNFNVSVSVGDASSYTYSLGYCLLP